MRVPALLVLALAGLSSAFSQTVEERLAEARRVADGWQGKVRALQIRPRWLEEGRWLWYQTGKGEPLILVDARNGKRQTALDPAIVAPKLGLEPNSFEPVLRKVAMPRLEFLLNGKRYEWDARREAVRELEAASAAEEGEGLRAFLPIRSSDTGPETTITFANRWDRAVDVWWVNNEGGQVRYHTLAPGQTRMQRTFVGHVWFFTEGGKTQPLAAYSATEDPGTASFDGKSPVVPPRPRSGVASPDGKQRIVVREHNLWVAVEGAEPRRLTTDGTAGDRYDEGSVRWSPDGKWVSALKIEAGGDRRIPIVDTSPTDQLQPRLRMIPYLKPGDKIARDRLVFAEVATGRTAVASEALTPNPWDLTRLGWSQDSRELYFVYNQRGHQTLRLLAADPATGQVRLVREERSPTFLDYAAKLWVRYLPGQEALWMTESSGWNHLLLLDLKTGAVKREVTEGPWMVRAVEEVDEASGDLLLRVLGRSTGQDPYHVHFLRTNWKNAKTVALTEGDGTHRISWSPDRKSYVATWSRVDKPPVHELRRASDGKLLTQLESANDEALRATGWSRPERFVAKGRDGKTDIWGVIWKPRGFDPSRKYAVIEQIYAGPHDHHVPKPYSILHGQRTLAHLGFVVVSIDGMGTNWRGKAFHDVAWKNLADSGFPDRILWMQAAAKERSWMDLTRVGVVGTSAGGQNAASAVMRFGDFYHAAVADCGCHDNRMDKVWWNELWMGYPVDESYARNSNVTAAKGLKGKLFLMVGEADTNVDPASTQQVVDALIRAGKDFEHLVAPNVGHGVLGTPYGQRRMAEFFLRHLGGPK